MCVSARFRVVPPAPGASPSRLHFDLHPYLRWDAAYRMGLRNHCPFACTDAG